MAVRLGVCFAIKCGGGCKIEAEKFIRRGVREREAAGIRKFGAKSGIRGQSGSFWFYLALFHAIFDFISPAARSNGQGKAAAPILYLLRAGLDWSTDSLSPSERAPRITLPPRKNNIWTVDWGLELFNLQTQLQSKFRIALLFPSSTQASLRSLAASITLENNYLSARARGGVTQVAQRQWRRQGITLKRGSRFSIFSLQGGAALADLL